MPELFKHLGDSVLLGMQRQGSQQVCQIYKVIKQNRPLTIEERNFL